MANTSESSITTTTRSDKSLFMRLLQLFVRPFGTYLVSPKSAAPAGSPRLSTTQSAAKGCSITERSLADCWLYDLHPKSSSNGAGGSSHHKKRIYYFAGGGWQMPPSSQHWSFCAYLAHSLPSAAITIVSYPLAPKTPAPSAFPILSALYSELLSACDDKGEQAVLVGDSAGGNVVLTMTLEALRKIDGSSEAQPTLKPLKLLLVSPAVDLTNENPAMKEAEKKDPIMNVAYVTSTANTWRGSWDSADPRLSPVKDDLALLAKAGVHVDGCIAGWDVLAPDALVLKDKLNNAAVQGHWLVWEGMMHCWPLARQYGLRESREAAEWCVERLKD